MMKFEIGRVANNMIKLPAPEVSVPKKGRLLVREAGKNKVFLVDLPMEADAGLFCFLCSLGQHFSGENAQVAICLISLHLQLERHALKYQPFYDRADQYPGADRRVKYYIFILE